MPNSKEPLQPTSNTRSEELRKHGWALVDESDIGLDHDLGHVRELVLNCEDLAPDLNAKAGTRFRTYDRATFDTATGELRFGLADGVTPTGLEYFRYELDSTTNPEIAGESRKMYRFPQPLRQNSTFEHVVRQMVHCYLQLPREPTVIDIVFHIIRLEPQDTDQAKATPDLVHTDDVQISSLHLISESNTIGGVSSVVNRKYANHPYRFVPSSQIFAEWKIRGFLAGYCFDDRRVAHYVTPIQRLSQDSPAHRTIMTIDYYPKYSEEL